MSNILHTLGVLHVSPDGQITIQGIGSMDELTKPLTNDDVIKWLKDFHEQLLDGTFIDTAHSIVRITPKGESSAIRVSRMIEIVIETIEEYQKSK